MPEKGSEGGSKATGEGEAKGQLLPITEGVEHMKPPPPPPGKFGAEPIKPPPPPPPPDKAKSARGK
jgi:hypothetical protein